jgi:hypothetical protein
MPGPIAGKRYKEPTPWSDMQQQPIQNQASKELEECHRKLKADRAWLQLMADQFKPHSQVSMNAWIQAREELSRSTLLFQLNLDWANYNAAQE